MGEVEYEPRDHAGLFAHHACFAAWRTESGLLRRAGDEEPGGAAAGA